jgi:hypothetical protein
MKNLALSLMAFFVFSIAHAGCLEQQSIEVRYSLTYLSLLENGGGSMITSVDGPSSENLCRNMKSTGVTASASNPGYDLVKLNFGLTACQILVQLGADGLVADSQPMSCGPAAADLAL